MEATMPGELRAVALTNRQTVESASDEMRPTVHRLVIAIEDGDPDTARRIAREVPADLREGTSRACRWVRWPSEGQHLADGIMATREDEARSVRAYLVAMVEITDDMRYLVDACHGWGGGPEVDLEDVASELERRPEAWRRSFARQFEGHPNGASWLMHRTLADRGLLPPPRDITPVPLLGLEWDRLPAARERYPEVARWVDALWTEPSAGTTIGRTDSAFDPNATRPLPADRSVYPESYWSGLLKAWGAFDPERRGAALDACLGALAGAAGEAQGDLRGWVLVHGRLQPTEAEIAERQSRYLDLAATGATDPARLARDVVARLRASALLEPDGLLDVSPECLLRREKNAVTQWLGILADAVAAGDLAASEVAEVVAEARPHLPRGTERKADALLETCGIATQPAAIEQTWTPPLPVDLPQPGRVEPVRSMDELVELLLSLEEAPDPIAVERAIDGMLRLREPNAAIAPHLPWSFVDAPGFGALVGRWAGRPTRAGRFGTRTAGRVYRAEDVPEGVAAQRMGMSRQFDEPPSIWSWSWEVPVWTPDDLIGKRLSQEALHLLTLPSSPSFTLPVGSHGGIDGDSLLARIRARRAAGSSLYLQETAAALLRLVPSDRSAVISEAFAGTRGARWLEFLEHPRPFCYGPVTPGGTKGQYVITDPVAAWRADDSAPPRDVEDPVSLWLDTSDTINHWGSYANPGYTQSGRAHGSAWVSQLPWHLDIAAVHLQPVLISKNEDSNTDLSGAIAQFAHARVPLGPQTVDALTWAATHLNIRTRTAAAETLAALARTEMVSGDVLTGSLLRLIGPDAGPFYGLQGGGSFHTDPAPPKLSRIASTLKDAARVNEHSERLVLDAVIGCLTHLKDMRGSVALLEIAAEIAERRGIRVHLPEPLAGLAAGRATTRLADEARRLSGASRPGATLYRPAKP